MFEPGVVDAAVDVLAGLAGRGRALELGIGTGRIALPLARRGVPVHGIDVSQAMVARLRAKAGGAAIGITIGDFAATRAAGTFSVAYLVFNTIMNLTAQAAKVACFRNVAAHLEPGGCFVIEVAVPDLRRLPAVVELELRRGSRWPRRVHLDSLPVRVAGRTRPDGPARRAATARAVGRVDAAALHQREPPACLDLGEASQLTASQSLILAAREQHAGNGDISRARIIHAQLR